MFSAAALLRLTFRICLTIVTSIIPPHPSEKNALSLFLCLFLFYFFVFSGITFHTSTTQNGLPSCCCSALFESWALATFFCHFPILLTHGPIVSAAFTFCLIFCCALQMCCKVWSVAGRVMLSSLLSVCSVNKVLFELALSLSFIRMSRPFILVNVWKNIAKTLH